MIKERSVGKVTIVFIVICICLLLTSCIPFCNRIEMGTTPIQLNFSDEMKGVSCTNVKHWVKSGVTRSVDIVIAELYSEKEYSCDESDISVFQKGTQKKHKVYGYNSAERYVKKKKVFIKLGVNRVDIRLKLRKNREDSVFVFFNSERSMTR